MLESVSIAKDKGVPIISIVNATTSSLAKISDVVIPLNCGVEVGVAATKSYTSQLVILYKIIEELSELKLVDFEIIADAAKNIFSTRSKIQSIAKKLKNQHSLFILGREFTIL